jgi:peroxiredoxin
MRRVLLAAAFCNLAWGAWTILFPQAMFRLAGMAAPNYPQLWQCIGMIVGVYGVGYAIAAFDPVRHWPIVLVGLLGKVLGPLGMIAALARSEVPWNFALTCVTNDLIWWLPFALVLRRAAAACREEGDAPPVPDAETALAQTRTDTGETIADISRRAPVLLVFLRHAGCTFCREALADLARQRPALGRAGTHLVFVHMSEIEGFRRFAAGYGLGDVPQVSDPERKLYRALGLRRGTLGQLLGWRVLVRGFQAAIFARHGLGAIQGDSTQMPGVFLIRDGRILAAHRHRDSADRPDYVAVCSLSSSS